MAKIIVLTNQKGGCGKTTLTINIALGLQKDNKKILIIDGDPQSSATKWAKNASDTCPFPCAITSLAVAQEKAHKTIEKFMPDYDYIVIDCPPAVDTGFNKSTLLVADLAIIPVITSPLDMYATVSIKSLIDDVQETREFKNVGLLQVRTLANMCQAGINMTNEVLEALVEYGYSKLNTDIYLRTIYRQSILEGKSVIDSKDRKAKTEMVHLIEEIKAILQ